MASATTFVHTTRSFAIRANTAITAVRYDHSLAARRDTRADTGRIEDVDARRPVLPHPALHSLSVREIRYGDWRTVMSASRAALSRPRASRAGETG